MEIVGVRRVLLASLIGPLLFQGFVPAMGRSQVHQEPRTLVVSRAENGDPGNSHSFDGIISGSGRFVTFASRAANLVDGDDNGVADIFVRDLVAGTLELVSRTSDGALANSASELPSISDDGRFVAFLSKASNLAGGFSWRHVYLHNRTTGRTIPISKSVDGGEANDVSGNPSVSGDGNYVVFSSWASNLVPDDTNGHVDTFVYDVRRGGIERVSVSSSGAEADGGSYPAWFHGAISGDGRLVAFVSNATNLVGGDAPASWDAFVHDRTTGATRRVSEHAGLRLPGSSRNVVIATDGSVVAIVQEQPAIRAEQLGVGVTNPNADIMVVDLRTGAVEVISSPEPFPRILYKNVVSVSGDGRYVAYSSKSPFQTAVDNKGTDNVYLYDRATGETSLVNVSTEGLPALGGESGAPSLSHDGRLVAFVSSSPTLSSDDAKTCIDQGVPYYCLDVFVRDRGPGRCADGRREEGPVSRLVAGSRWHAPRVLRPPLLRLGCVVAGADA